MDKGFKMSARRGRSGAWKGVGGVFGVFESVGSGKTNISNQHRLHWLIPQRNDDIFY